MDTVLAKYPWVVFHKELANAILKYKNDRQLLLRWMKEELSDVRRSDNVKLWFCGKLLEPTRKDIDPFSIFSILCRIYQFETLERIFPIYKKFFQIETPASSSSWGIVTTNTSYFFFTNDKHTINLLWKLFEKAINGKSFEKEYNELIENNDTRYYLTYALSWVCPETFLALNKPIRDFLLEYGIEISSIPSYKQYNDILKKVKYKIEKKEIACSSLMELTELVQKKSSSIKIWFIPLEYRNSQNNNINLQELYNHNEKAIEHLYLEAIPRQDIVVLYGNNNELQQLIYGWGRFKSSGIRLTSNMLSEIEWNMYDNNPILWDGLPLNGLYEVIATPHLLKSLKISHNKIDCDMKSNIMKYVDLLELNKNLILTGAPGTGKTHMAKMIAAVILGLKNTDELEKNNKRFKFVQFHPSYDYTDFVEGLRPIEKNNNLGFKRVNGVFKDLCENALSPLKKHEGYFTEKDANMGLAIFKNKSNGVVLWKPDDKDSGTFTIVTEWNAPIYAIPRVDKYSIVPIKVSEDDIIEYLTNPLIDNSDKDPYAESIADYIGNYILGSKYVLIIDEINRGEISKIFGELFFSIDPGYRGEKGIVLTQYQNMIEEENVFKNGFYVPNNVYIIGTMNDIDRSVEDMDFAMQRRFAKVEVTAEESYQNILADNNDFSEDEKTEIKARMTALNDAILEPELGLGEAYQIGAAYFLKYLKYKKHGMKQAFTMLWDYHLKGLLSDYLRGSHNPKDQLDALKEAYDSKVKKHE